MAQELTAKELYIALEPLWNASMSYCPGCTQYPKGKVPGPEDQVAPPITAFWTKLDSMLSEHTAFEPETAPLRPLSSRQVTCAEEAVRQLRKYNIFSVMHEVGDFLCNYHDWDHPLSETEHLFLYSLCSAALQYILYTKLWISIKNEERG